MIVVYARLPLDRAERDAALDAVRTVAERSRTEDGVLDYRAAVALDDRNTVLLFQRYRDETAFAAHFGSDHFATFEAAIDPRLDGEPDVLRFDVASMTDLEA